ncbi:MAG: hypothetical protein LUH22_19765 [Bacteroides sp.]|nr:hypothetical protein [Bacteroides sp.]
MKKNLFLVAIVLLTSLLYSCDYDLTDNYVHIDEPTETPVDIDLNMISNGESFIIHKESDIEFALTAFGKDINSAIFKMGAKEWKFNKEEEGIISITEEEFPTGDYTLTCDLFIKSSSGSIADQYDTEFLSNSLSWPVLIDYNLNIPATVLSKINKDGYLELNWTKPTLSYLKVNSYQVHYDNAEVYRENTVEETQETVFIDRNYVGEAAAYHIFMELISEHDSKTHLWSVGSIEVPEQFKLYVNSSTVNEIEIRWENPVRNSFALLVNDEKVTLTEGQTYLRLASTGFGSTQPADQYQIEAQLAPYDSPEEPVFSRNLLAGCYGQVISETWTRFGWNKVENILYTASSNGLCSYTVPELTQAKVAVEADTDYYFDQIASSPISTKVAVLMNSTIVSKEKQITIYDGRFLNKLMTIPCNDIRLETTLGQKLFFLTIDDKLVYFASSGSSSLRGVVYDALTGNKEREFEVYSESDIFRFTLSPNGRYLVTTESNVIRIFELDNYQVSNRRDITQTTDNIYEFNPVNYNELFTSNSEGRKLIVRNISDWSVMREMALPSPYEICNIDPLNGNLLVKTTNELRIYNTYADKLLFSSANKGSHIRLLGNTLTSYDGLIFNLNNYFAR